MVINFLVYVKHPGQCVSSKTQMIYDMMIWRWW